MYILSFTNFSGKRCAVRYRHARSCFLIGDFEARRNPGANAVMYRKYAGKLIQIWRFEKGGSSLERG